MHTKLSKVMDAYCTRQGLTRDSVRFLLDGNQVHNDVTPESRGMEDGDVLEIFVQQLDGDGTNGGENPDHAKQPKEEPKVINITVKDDKNASITFKLKQTTKLQKLMDAYTQQQGRKPNSLRFFMSDGHRITNDETPLSLQMEDEEVIDVHEEQQGGNNKQVWVGHWCMKTAVSCSAMNIR